jgi:hypothetical protein
VKILLRIALTVGCAAGAAALLCLGACSAGGGGSGAGGCPNLSTCPATPPSWSGQVESIVNTYCATPACHGPGGIEAAQYDYSTYAGVHGHYVPMLTQVAQCLMPPGDASPPLPDDLRQTLLCWLEAEAPDN